MLSFGNKSVVSKKVTKWKMSAHTQSKNYFIPVSGLSLSFAYSLNSEKKISIPV
jgi:hypothetical protein